MNILLVDDHALFRQGFKLLLESSLQERHCITEVSSAESGLVAAQGTDFDLIFLDLGLPGVGGMEALRLFRRHCSSSALVVLSAIDSAGVVKTALELGAQGYISKVRSLESIGDVLDMIMAGQVYAPTELAACQETTVRLTGRQMEVLMEMCAGRTNREIACRLGIGENTARSHASSIFSLLRVRSRTEAVVFAKRNGWY